MATKRGLCISRKDLDGIRARYNGTTALRHTLESIRTHRELVVFFTHFVQFSLPFSAGAAHLAGTIANASHLFLDAQTTAPTLADRSYEVARSVFAALEGDFADHRALAQYFLHELSRYCCGVQSLDGMPAEVDSDTRQSMQHIRDGYGLGRVLADEELFTAFGFHLGAELLGDAEFKIIDTHLRAHRPSLVSHLEQQTTVINGESHDAYAWISIHAHVEVEHFNKGLAGAHLALKHYAGPHDKLTIRARMLDGFAAFARMQASAMTRL